MDIFSLGLVAVLVALFLLAMHRSSGVRTTAQIVILVLFVLCIAVAGASLYGMVKLGDKGGGVLFFVALIAGFIAFVLFHLLGAAREHERYLSMDVDAQQEYAVEKIAEMRADLEDVIARNSLEVDRFWISSRKRRRLQAEIDHAQMLLRHFDELERQRGVQLPEAERWGSRG
jgi:hypothetical protein